MGLELSPVCTDLGSALEALAEAGVEFFEFDG
jgi:hypothetical protein